MINVVIVEDEIFFREKYQQIVNKIKLKLKVNITIHSFSRYNEELENIINSDLENKIYIFDIELSSMLGTDIARFIRKKDKKSLIIFITCHYDKYMKELLTSTLLYLRYISKLDNYLEILEETLITAITEIDCDHIITVETLDINYYINVEDILYIYTYDRINHIITPYNDIPCRNRTIKSFIDTLPQNFELSHRACLVNLRKIDYINRKEKIIYMKNGLAIDLLSKQNMKNIIEKLKYFN